MIDLLQYIDELKKIKQLNKLTIKWSFKFEK